MKKETKTSSASLSLFATPDELAGYIKLIVENYNLVTISYVLSEDVLSLVNLGDLESKIYISERIFLGSKDQVKSNYKINDISPREWGWIDIRPGKLLEIDGIKMLTLTEIDGESSKKVKEQAPTIIRWLKRQIKKEVTFGVYGFASAGGKGSSYGDIGYTQGALSLFNSGVIWKQDPTLKPFFRPNLEKITL